MSCSSGSSSSNVFPLRPQSSVVQRGIVPTLVTVAALSYSANAAYSSGAAVVNQYNNQLVVSNSSSAIRQHDNEVQVSIQVALDLTLANPGFAGELRIIPTPPTPTTPGAFAQALPAPDPHYGLPLLEDVEVILSNTGAPALAGVVVGILQARYLYGGKLALIAFDPATGNETPLTAANLAALFGSGVAGQQLLIRVNGSYRGASSPN